MPQIRKHTDDTERKRVFRHKQADRLREFEAMTAQVKELEARVRDLEKVADASTIASSAAPAFPEEPGRERWQAMLDHGWPIFETIRDEMEAARRTQQEFLDYNNEWIKTKRNKPGPLKTYIKDFDECMSRVALGINAQCRFPLRPGEEVPEDWDE